MYQLFIIYYQLYIVHKTIHDYFDFLLILFQKLLI